MGCDIHGYIESQPYKETSLEYWWLNADLSITRNYAMFGLLAGVRGGDAPLFAPRGWDEKSATKYEYCLYVSDDDCDDEHYCSKENADRWIRYGSSKLVSENMITHPDWHTASWLTTKELESVIAAYKEKYPEYKTDEWDAILAFMKHVPYCRFTFWFDN